MIRKFFRLLSILVLCAALFFGYQTLEWSSKYKQGHDEYEKLQAQNTPENESTPENDSDSTKELPFCPDWTALKAENPDNQVIIRIYSYPDPGSNRDGSESTGV